MSKFEVGDIVYVNASWNVADKCYVMSSFVDGGNQFYKIESYSLGGVFTALEDSIFSTHKEALDAANAVFNKEVKKYKSEIKTVSDLIKFPLNHCLDGEEYTDYAAIEAYKKRASELLNINI